jgi:hypothetical protein
MPTVIDEPPVYQSLIPKGEMYDLGRRSVVVVKP